MKIFKNHCEKEIIYWADDSCRLHEDYKLDVVTVCNLNLFFPLLNNTEITLKRWSEKK